ncbi:MAG: polymerase, sigma-24 subunit, subfamily, partial [Thermoleophilia bacterium]|nr:polymerase, sigma-24 subunit, subfamily [Thermoleophilia bacterium]
MTQAAFTTVVAPHTRELEVHCYRMLGSFHDAQDAMQETLVRVWRGIDAMEDRGALRPWLYRIATNVCTDELAGRPRRPEPVDPYPDARIEGLGAQIVDPEARYAQREGMELAFLTAIQQLPGTQRAALILRDVLGWSAAETADLLDVTLAAANSMLQRARETIDPAVAAVSPTPVASAQRVLLSRYVNAWEQVDVEALVALVREDAVLRMPPQPHVHGPADILAFLLGRADIRTLRVTPTLANGRPALVLHRIDAAAAG